MPSRQQVPPIYDPRWREWSAPLLAFIRERPRTWAELYEWQKASEIRPSMLKHMLCWLEFNGSVVGWICRDPILWVAKEHNDDVEAT